jgi:RNA polymerase sigma-70 factor (ECF subfamily)
MSQPRWGARRAQSRINSGPQAGHIAEAATIVTISAGIVTIRHKWVPTWLQDSRRGPSYLHRKRPGNSLAETQAKLMEAKSVAQADDKVLEHIPGLRRYARALAGGAAEADDLVQETLTRVLARRHKSSEIRNLRAYLFTILHNAHIDRLNERKRWTYSIPDEVLENHLPQPAPQTSQIELHDLAKALQRLPEEQRQAVLLVGYEGMAYKEAAAALDIPIGTVMSRLSRGREALRRMMAGRPAADLRRVPDAREELRKAQ